MLQKEVLELRLSVNVAHVFSIFATCLQFRCVDYTIVIIIDITIIVLLFLSQNLFLNTQVKYNQQVVTSHFVGSQSHQNSVLPIVRQLTDLLHFGNVLQSPSFFQKCNKFAPFNTLFFNIFWERTPTPTPLPARDGRLP